MLSLRALVMLIAYDVLCTFSTFGTSTPARGAN